MTRHDGWPTARVVIMLAMAAWQSGCGLIDSGLFGGGDQPVDGLNCTDDEGGLFCSCADPVDDTEFCETDACLCIDGSLECPETTSTCEVLNDDGCANAACFCDDGGNTEGCVCGNVPGTCTGNNAVVRTFEAGVGCEGDCTCRAILGDLPSCRCNGAVCQVETNGARCTSADECAILSHARQVGCFDGPGPLGCGVDEVCVTTGQGLSYCFVNGETGCPPNLTAVTFDGNNVCVDTGGNAPDCVSSTCVDGT